MEGDGGWGQHPNDEEALLTNLSWRFPPIDLSTDGEHLEMPLRTNWKSHAATRRARVPPGGLLAPFCSLARETAPKVQRRRVLSFAKRYGLLGLCKTHRHPAASCFERGCNFWEWEEGHGQNQGRIEAIEDWILWARRFGGTLVIAPGIHRDRSLNPADVEDAFALVQHARYAKFPDIFRRPQPSRVTERQPDGTYRPVKQDQQWERQDHETELFYLKEWLNYLLSIAAVNRRVVEGKGRKGHQLLEIADAYHESCPLFGALVIELVGECTGVSSQSRCANARCQKGFRPTHRNQKYCGRCRAKQVSQQLATQRFRDSRRKQGLSVRGRPLPQAATDRIDSQ